MLSLNLNKYKNIIKGVIHVGANRGEEYQDYMDMKIENMIFFEPLPDAFSELTSKVGKERCFNYAVGSSNKEVEMFVDEVNLGHSSSVLSPKLHLEKYPHIQFTKKIIASQISLDWFVENNHIDLNKFNFLNVDVQGYELEVFKGAKSLLEKIDVILTEVNLNELYENCSLLKDIDDYLKNYNFVRVDLRLDPNEWGDALYVKN